VTGFSTSPLDRDDLNLVRFGREGLLDGGVEFGEIINGTDPAYNPANPG
jgi:hypothetical protein